MKELVKSGIKNVTIIIIIIISFPLFVPLAKTINKRYLLVHNNNVVKKQKLIDTQQAYVKGKKNVLIFAEAFATCIDRKARNSNVVDIRSGRLTSMERKNFDVVRWLFLMPILFHTKCFLLLILLRQYFIVSFRLKKQTHSTTEPRFSCSLSLPIALVLDEEIYMKRT